MHKMKEWGNATLLALTLLSITIPIANAQKPSGDGLKCEQITPVDEKYNAIGMQGSPLDGVLPTRWNGKISVRLALSPYGDAMAVLADHRVGIQTMGQDIVHGSIAPADRLLFAESPGVISERILALRHKALDCVEIRQVGPPSNFQPELWQQILSAIPILAIIIGASFGGPILKAKIKDELQKRGS